MVEQRSNHNPNRFSGLIPRDNGFSPDDFANQVPVEGRLGYLAGTNFQERPRQGEKFGKKEAKKAKKI